MKERLLILIDNLLENKTSFSNALGITPQTLNMYLSGNRNFTNKFLFKVQKAYPIVNIAWLKTGKGEMLLNSGVSVLELHNKDDTEKEFLKKENEFLKSKVDFLESEIVKLKEMLLREVGEFVSTKGQINSIVKKNNRNNNRK